ncbi:MAG: formaldehyde-activating enzyme [Acidimicrobiia bacterium]
MTFAAVTQIGEAFVGEGVDAAHVNTVLGRYGGPVETAWVTALATPRVGYAPFVAVLKPNVPVKPLTLFVTKADIRGDEHGALVWGAAQAGVAGGVADAVAEGVIPHDDVDALLLVVAVWVSWSAAEADAVYANNREATHTALIRGAAGRPSLAEVLQARDSPANPYYQPSVDP